MNKKFVINLGLLLLLNFLIKPFYILGIDAEIQSRVGAEVYGQYFSLLGLSFLLNIILDVGIVNYNTRNIAQHNFLLQKYFGHIIGLRLSLSVLYTLVTFGVGIVLGYEKESFYLLGWLVFNQIIASLILYVRSNLSGLLLFRRDSIISVMDRALLIIICGALLWGGITEQEFNIYWFVYAQSFAYGITLITALFFLVSKQKVSLPKVKRKVSLNILKKSFPYALLILLMTIYYRSDSVMLERMLPDGEYQAGIYANGFRFFEAANNIGLLFATLLLPIFSNLLKQHKKVDSLTAIASKILLTGAIILATLCYIFQQEIIGLRYENAPALSGEVFGLLMLCFVFISSTYIFGTLLTANGDLKTLNKVAFAGVVLNIVLNLILIPTHKAYGAALASLITQGLTAIAQILLCTKVFKFKLNWNLIAGFGLLITTGVVFYVLQVNNVIKFSGTFLKELGLIFLFLLSVIPLSGLIKWKDIKKIIALVKTKNG